MDRNTAIIITRMGNGFQVRAEGKEIDDILVFESKANMLKAVDKHFSDKRDKKWYRISDLTPADGIEPPLEKRGEKKEGGE